MQKSSVKLYDLELSELSFPTELEPTEASNHLYLQYSTLLASLSQEYQEIIQNIPKNDPLWEEIYQYLHDVLGIMSKSKELGELALNLAELFINKIICYYIARHLLRSQFGAQIPTLIEEVPKDEIPLKTLLIDRFCTLVSQYGFTPIFQPDALLQTIPFPDHNTNLLRNFIDYLTKFTWNALGLDTIGILASGLIPPLKREKLGEIYTPETIASLMVQLAIRDPNVTIFDPACGCGILLTKALSHLRSLIRDHPITASSPHNFSDQVWGVEINPLLAYMGMLALTFSDPEQVIDRSTIIVGDFFQLGPLNQHFVKTRHLLSGKSISRQMPNKFDVILANPPYIKQELIPHKKELFDQLPGFAAYRQSPLTIEKEFRSQRGSPKVPMELSGKTDYYGFFLWYSTFFLRENGMLCFLIPNKWLDVQYGAEIKAFLLSKYRILAIIGFDQNIFAAAQVSNVILLAQKENDKSIRDNNIIRFVQLTSDRGSQLLPQLIFDAPSANILKLLHTQGFNFKYDSQAYRITYIIQNRLNSNEKWAVQYLYQSHFAQILRQQQLLSLDNNVITRVVGGVKTGANRFFFPNPNDIEQYQIEPLFFKPGISAGRHIPKSPYITSVNEYFLAIPATTVLSQFPGLQAYIEAAEEADIPSRPSLQWKPWYSIPSDRQDCPDILFLRHIDATLHGKWNQIKAIVADGVRGIEIFQSDHILFYLGLVNSTFFYWQAHLHGRWEGQGDLQLLVYELKQFQIPDIRSLSPSKILAVEQVTQEIFNSTEREGQGKNYLVDPALQRRLDLAVLDCMALLDSYDLLISETKRLESLRLQKRLISS